MATSRRGIARLGLLLALGWAVSPERAVAGQGGTLSAKWLGQVGVDRVGRSSEAGPNGVQDMTVELRGLDVALEIVRITMTGHGRDEWNYRGTRSSWAADLQRAEGSDTGLLSVEPSQVETGRRFVVEVEYEGGRIDHAALMGGAADLMLRRPDVQLDAHWLGAVDADHTGPGGGVGPDGEADLAIDLVRLAADREVVSLIVRSEDGRGWSFGRNSDGVDDALLIRSADDPSRARVFFSPEGELRGNRLRVEVRYDNHTGDRVVLEAGPIGPRPIVRRPGLPKIAMEEIRAAWVGPVEGSPAGLGAIRLSIERSAPRRPVAVVLSDGVAAGWSNREPSEDAPGPFVERYRRPLSLRPGPKPGSFDLDFVPSRDMAGSTLTLRMIDPDGNESIAEIEGQACDPAIAFERPSARVRTVRPGDDLATAVAKGGTVRLESGTYRLDRPLDLSTPVAIEGEEGAVLRFRQPEGAEPWSEAIAIRTKGLCRLSGFGVRFDGAIRWNQTVAWEPAILGVATTGTRPGGPVRLEVTGMDLEAPLGTGTWERAPKCMRFVDTDSGLIEDCTLKGGEIEFFKGPWRVARNRHRGTQPGTFAGSFLSAHRTWDLEVLDNHVEPERPSGKLYRFLILTDTGHHVLIRGNRSIGVGPMDDDDRPHPNAPEVLLTESYYLRYEGAAVEESADGRFLAFGEPQGEPMATGDVVSILSGPKAGTWATVAQVVGPSSVRVDRPLPTGGGAVHVGPGFVGVRIEGNTIDCRGSSEANNLVLTGNHYGTEVVDNDLSGGRYAFRVFAHATAEPYHWGWSRVPSFGVRVEDNRVVDSLLGGLFAVFHAEGEKLSRGRLYLTASALGNTFRWTELSPEIPDGGRVALTIGQLPAIDPAELSLQSGSNAALGPGGEAVPEPMAIRVGTINGRDYQPSTPE